MDPLVYFDVPVLDSLLTEQRNPASEKIDTASTPELLRIINQEDQKVAAAVDLEIPRIAQAVDAIVERFQAGGRLFYAGAGTSGRLGVLDAAECPPTFGVPPGRVQAVIAGGPDAVLRASEGSEDRTDTAESDLRAKGLTKNDSLVAISASGRTPYAVAAAVHARSLGAFTVGLSGNPESELASQVDVAISPVAGPEVITGSTRMKAGTAQKLVLNMISTAVMVRMGYVLGNLMVNVQLNSAKLRDRGRRIVAEVADCTREGAARALAGSGDNVRAAILMAKFQVNRGQAEAMLRQAGDSLWKAIETGQQHSTDSQ